MEHDPLCVLSDPCWPDDPAHGYCGFSEPRFCIHCSQWCICERLGKARADEREQAAQRLLGWFAARRIDVVDEAVAAVRGEAP